MNNEWKNYNNAVGTKIRMCVFLRKILNENPRLLY